VAAPRAQRAGVRLGSRCCRERATDRRDRHAERRRPRAVPEQGAVPGLRRGRDATGGPDDDTSQGCTRKPGPVAAGTGGPWALFAVYDAAFRDRPGFPGWPRKRWVDWVSGDDDFRPDWTLLAALDGTDVGFIVGDASGWIIQLGVVPAARGKAIGAVLIGEAVRRMRAGGDTTITLNVNVDNPHAIALYRRLGFARTGRRARYRRA
jgi:GNAT superfamily N-acetyltransferase